MQFILSKVQSLCSVLKKFSWLTYFGQMIKKDNQNVTLIVLM